jgi:hypothetical protein
MASDVIRDGMGLELTDLDAPERGPVLAAFWHDDGTTVVDQHGNARNVAITSTQNAQGGVTLTLTVDGKTAYSGSGKLKLVGGGILGSFNTAGGSGNSEFGLSIRDKKDA